MVFIYIALIFILIGLSLWVAGAVIHKKAIVFERKKRKKQQERAILFGSIAKVILIVAALFFILGFMMISGVKIDQQ
jgi:predicted permease